jgi:hypothetical protein
MKSTKGFRYLQMYINEAQKWYFENKMEFGVQKSSVISSSLKTNSTHFN